MGFFVKQPVNHSATTATYLWAGQDIPGVFIVEVDGDAQNFSYAFSLLRDDDVADGLKIDVMGWSGPLTKGTMPYKVSHAFPGEYQKSIIISGANGDAVVSVKEITHDKADEYLMLQLTERL